MTEQGYPLRREDGYSLIEMMFTVGIMAVLAAMAVVQIGSSQSAAETHPVPVPNWLA